MLDKRWLPFCVLGILLLHTISAHGGDAKDIEQVIQSAYIEGIHIEGNTEKIRAGFHPSFTMSILRDDTIVKVSIEDWIRRIEEGKAKRAKEPKPKVEAKYAMVSVSGNAAIARVEVSRQGKHVYTDFLSLYRFQRGWMIVAKTFFGH